LLDGRLGVCVVGAGERGTQHARAWESLGNVRLVAVADIDRGRAERLAEELNFDFWSTDFRSAVSQPGVDIVSICTPAYFHPEVAVFSAEKSRHILCEKPIALTLEAADVIIEAARENDVKLSIGFQRRYTKYAETLAEVIQKGEIGRPVMFRLESAVEIRPKRAMHDRRRGNAGPVVDGCCHYFDLWRMIFNSEPTRVTARGFTFAEGRKELEGIEELAPDTVALIVEHASGDLGVITVSWGLPPGVKGRRGSDILGPEGVILLNRELRVIKEGGVERRIGPFVEDALREEVRSFAQSVLTDTEPKVTGEDGRVALRVSLAALESIETGETVELR